MANLARFHYLAGIASAAVCFGVYLATIAPSITWQHDGADSGDLVTAAYTLGIPHPTGYPLYMLLAALFSHFPGLEPAYGVNLLSALCAAAAVLLFYWACYSLAIQKIGQPFATLIGAAVAAGLGLGPLIWSQAVIAEVYALNALLVALLLLALVGSSPRQVQIAALAIGLGLAHHITILLLVPATLSSILAGGKTKKNIFTPLALLLLPLLFYLYLPLRASAAPPINWGNASTWEGFIWLVTGAAYHDYIFSLDMPQAFSRAILATRYLFDQFTLPGVAVGLWGAYRMMVENERGSRVRGLALALGFGMILLYSVLYS